MNLALTSIRVSLGPISVLQSVVPRTLVLATGTGALPYSVTPLKSMRPLPLVHPLALVLHADAMAFALRPRTLEGVATGPRVHTQDLKTVAPRTGVLALAFGPCADAVAMGLAFVPPATVRPPIVKVEPAPSGHA